MDVTGVVLLDQNYRYQYSMLVQPDIAQRGVVSLQQQQQKTEPIGLYSAAHKFLFCGSYCFPTVLLIPLTKSNTAGA